MFWTLGLNDIIPEIFSLLYVAAKMLKIFRQAIKTGCLQYLHLIKTVKLRPTGL